MRCYSSLVLAVLASVLCVASAGLLRENLSSTSAQRVPLYTRDFYVRFQASEEGKPDKQCGGVRLNEKWILTAAECLDNVQYTNVTITALTNKNTLSHHQVPLRKLDYIIHGKFDNGTKSFNLALVKPNFEDWNDQFTHVRLPSKSKTSEPFLGQVAVVTRYDLPANPGFNEVLSVPNLEVKLAEAWYCIGPYTPPMTRDDQFCVYPTNGKGLTEDDLGAPVTVDVLGKPQLLGIVLDIAPAMDDIANPFVFTSIIPHLDWISRLTRIPVTELPYPYE